MLQGVKRDQLPHLKQYWPPFDDAIRQRSRARAQAALSGSWPLLGFPVDLAGTVDWHRDPRTGYRWPRTFYADVPLGGLPDGVDVKYVWELARHQYAVELARAWLFGHGQQYASRARELILDWIDQNPLYEGVHWTSALEVAMRAISWIWTLATLADWDGWQDADLQRIAASLADHATYLEHHLSLYSSPYNHLIGEATALYLIGWVFRQGPAAGGDGRESDPGAEADTSCRLPAKTAHPAERWWRRGRHVLSEHGPRQFYRDGFCVEQAVGYHFFTLGFLSMAIVAARREGQPLPEVEEVAHRAFRAAAAFQQPDGRWPPIGDVDSARSIPVHHDDFWDFRSLMALGAALFEDPELKACSEEPGEELYWLLGCEGIQRWERLTESGNRSQEAGLRRQESGGRRQESGGRRQESGGRRQESGVRGQVSGSRSQGAGNRRQKSGNRSQEAGGRSQRAGASAPGTKHQARRTSDTRPPDHQTTRPPDHQAPGTRHQTTTCTLLEDSGYAIVRSGPDWLLFDAGPVAEGLYRDGTPSTAHGHADTLQVLLWLDGRPVLVDSGMPFYTGDPEWVRHFRSPAAHNTLQVEGVGFVRDAGGLDWTHAAPRPELKANFNGRMLVACARATFKSAWRRKPRVWVERQVLFLPGRGVWIADWIRCDRPRRVSGYWQLAGASAGVEHKRSGSGVRLEIDQWTFAACSQGADLQVQVRRATERSPAGWRAPGYGQREPGSTLMWAAEGVRDGVVLTYMGRGLGTASVSLGGHAVSCGTERHEVRDPDALPAGADVVWYVEEPQGTLVVAAGDRLDQLPEGWHGPAGTGNWPAACARLAGQSNGYAPARAERLVCGD